jgi:hypothetical protein
MKISVKQQILAILEAQRQRTFRAYEIENLINDKVQQGVDPRAITSTLASMASQGEIISNEMNHYRFLSAKSANSFSSGFHLAPYIIEALRKSGKSFSEEIDGIICGNATANQC